MDMRVSEIKAQLAKKWSEYTDNSDLINAFIDGIDISEYQPLRLERRICEIDKNALFTDVDKAINMLEQYKGKGYFIEEVWSGYEDNYILVCEDTQETVEDIVQRLDGDYKRKIIEKDRDKTALMKKKEALLKELRELELQELGI